MATCSITTAIMTHGKRRLLHISCKYGVAIFVNIQNIRTRLVHSLLIVWSLILLARYLHQTECQRSWVPWNGVHLIMRTKKEFIYVFLLPIFTMGETLVPTMFSYVKLYAEAILFQIYIFYVPKHDYK